MPMGYRRLGPPVEGCLPRRQRFPFRRGRTARQSVNPLQGNRASPPSSPRRPPERRSPIPMVQERRLPNQRRLHRPRPQPPRHRLGPSLHGLLVGRWCRRPRLRRHRRPRLGRHPVPLAPRLPPWLNPRAAKRRSNAPRVTRRPLCHQRWIVCRRRRLECRRAPRPGRQRNRLLPMRPHNQTRANLPRQSRRHSREPNRLQRPGRQAPQRRRHRFRLGPVPARQPARSPPRHPPDRSLPRHLQRRHPRQCRRCRAWISRARWRDCVASLRSGWAATPMFWPTWKAEETIRLLVSTGQCHHEKVVRYAVSRLFHFSATILLRRHRPKRWPVGRSARLNGRCRASSCTRPQRRRAATRKSPSRRNR